MVSNNGGHTKHLDNTGVPVARTSKGSLFFAPKLREPRILFTIGEEAVHVLHIRHGAQRYLHEE
jgi:hypothetical protein